MSGRKALILAALAVLILATGAAAYILGSSRSDTPEKTLQPQSSEQSDEPDISNITYQTTAVTAGSKTYNVQIADSTYKQDIGLGVRKSIGGDGMIFPFAKPQQLCFWMKDMHYPIDMIWLGADKQVLKIEANVSPDTYPRTTYCQDNAQYVVELDSGQAKAAGIQTGSILLFTL